MKEIIKIGHRGAAGYEPENTLRSFQKAIDLGVDMIEVDVFACKSGEVVALHDPKLQRTTSGHGYVIKKSLRELKMLDAGKGERIPTLEEVFDLVNRRVKINIEIKGARSLRSVIRIVNKYVYEKGWRYDDFLVSCVTRHSLRKIFKINPQLPVGAILIYKPNRFLAFAVQINAYSVNVRFRLLNAVFVEKAHQRGLKVFAWTVNEPEDIKRMKALGVDGIFSDYPDRI